MGVPGFFLWLWKKYKNQYFVFNKEDIDKEKYKTIDNIDELLIDANCLIHPQCYRILSENKNWTNLDKLENLMLDQIIAYIEEIIQFVSPKKCIYIAVDGVAPVAKIKQQRIRRFKSVKDKILFDNIKKKYNKPIDNHWNNSSISPGTQFMQRITSKILEYIKNKKLNDFKNIKVLFSSGNTPGEGEHKLLQHIRKKDKKDNSSYAIYGLDADLIFLALSTQKENIYLIREANQMDNSQTDTLNYVSIDVMKECIHKELLSKVNKEILGSECLQMNNMMNDFIFICYFLGNDFLAHIPSIDIKNYESNGLDVLVEAYIHTINNIQTNVLKIGEKIEFNDMFMLPFLEYLSFKEADFFKNLKKKRVRPCDSTDPYENEMYRIDNLLFPIDDPIKLGNNENWKFDYYEHYFNVTINQQKFINQVCKNYFIGLLWIANYYFAECASWDWYYPFDHAPFISDLANSLKDVKFDEIVFHKNQPIKPLVQLLSVLPPQSAFLVPQSYKDIMLSEKSPIIDLYPNDFQLDMLYKHRYWECIPLLPALNIAAVIKATEKKKLNKEEEQRNEQRDDIYVF